MAMAQGGTAIMAVRHHKSRSSSRMAIRQMIRGQAKRMIQDTIKKAPIMIQRILGGQMTLGTIVIQVVIETKRVMGKSFYNDLKTRKRSRKGFAAKLGKEVLTIFITRRLGVLSVLLLVNFVHSLSI